MHGKPSLVNHTKTNLFSHISSPFTAGRYHSLVAEAVPDCLSVTASTEDGKVMAIEHKELLISAVQFHPESIMTLGNESGYRLIENVVKSMANCIHKTQ